jgi:hypothetical protein
MLAEITSEMAYIVRPRATGVEREPAAVRKPFSLLRGTKGSNPSLSSEESIANLTPADLTAELQA